ncbi:MAG: hypothetical protein IJN37_06345 [Clostridia bacterium]|nr:hypothetical protein [Clostridia bacterium]
MQNYSRSVKSHLWSSRTFHRLSAIEKAVYLYLLTGPVTSDTSVYLMPLDQAALDVGVSIEEIERIIKHFEELELVVYDWDEEEICVIDYFQFGTSPIGGLNYEMYSKDFDKINSKELIGYAKESAKRADISMAFFAALQDVYPEICEDDYPIRATEKTAKDMREAAKRGRKKISERRKKVTGKEEVKPTEKEEMSPELYDDLPF